MTDRVLLTRLFEKVSARGDRYFVDRLGAARVLMLSNSTSENGEPVWQVFACPTEAWTPAAESKPESKPAPKPEGNGAKLKLSFGRPNGHHGR
jgi:hypothetical protein